MHKYVGKKMSQGVVSTQNERQTQALEIHKQINFTSYVLNQMEK